MQVKVYKNINFSLSVEQQTNQKTLSDMWHSTPLQKTNADCQNERDKIVAIFKAKKSESNITYEQRRGYAVLSKNIVI